ncbi:helix-turn-helix transcriptional regulator [Mycobacteroides salmoniphilum]|uniref:Nucleoid-associated protein EspR n=1 Tax=Mycobacteroides salmoniphilum TaxID=404941 RepID=A0A4R8SLI1_9MYCO|nr:helix-turn-helix transcriptional regulator [Mycobacteroides salmoniphilum]TDZ98591.1 Nucleoid-associated protein EspR [Mycobacteroides salmoniphilum]TEA03121.1 Nucleoid-associated protein EspR [Mycobacteroides salmoniphilum]
MPDFSQRLSHLFATVHPAGRGPYSLNEVVAALGQRGVEVSSPYLSLLRKGERSNPAPDIVTALAEFFQVSPAYFYDADYAASVNRDLDWLVQLRDSKVREIAQRSYALSENSRQAIADMVDHLRKVEGIPDKEAGASKSS